MKSLPLLRLCVNISICLIETVTERVVLPQKYCYRNRRRQHDPPGLLLANAIVWLVGDPKTRYGMKVQSVGKSSGVRVVPVSSALVLQGKSEEQE